MKPETFTESLRHGMFTISHAYVPSTNPDSNDEVRTLTGVASYAWEYGGQKFRASIEREHEVQHARPPWAHEGVVYQAWRCTLESRDTELGDHVRTMTFRYWEAEGTTFNDATLFDAFMSAFDVVHFDDEVYDIFTYAQAIGANLNDKQSFDAVRVGWEMTEAIRDGSRYVFEQTPAVNAEARMYATAEFFAHMQERFSPSY